MDFYRKEGFQVALDDVGADYSSLNILAQPKPDFVKLAMVLVRNIDHDKTKAIMARKLIETVKELEWATIAEGIESVEELDWMRDVGGDFARGDFFFFARPNLPPPRVLAA